MPNIPIPAGPPAGPGAPPPDPMMLLQQAMALAGQNPELLAILSQLQALLSPPGPLDGRQEMMNPGMQGMFPGGGVPGP